MVKSTMISPRDSSWGSGAKDLHSATPGACGGEQGEMGWLSVVWVNDSDPMDDILYVYVYVYMYMYVYIYIYVDR